MNPFEFLWAISLTVGLPIVFLTQLLRYRRDRLLAKGGAAGDGLRMSELQSLIARRVADETAELRARVEALEEIEAGRSDDVKLLAAPRSARLTLPDAEDEEALAAAPRARTRA